MLPTAYAKRCAQRILGSISTGCAVKPMPSVPNYACNRLCIALQTCAASSHAPRITSRFLHTSKQTHKPVFLGFHRGLAYDGALCRQLGVRLGASRLGWRGMAGREGKQRGWTGHCRVGCVQSLQLHHSLVVQYKCDWRGSKHARSLARCIQSTAAEILPKKVEPRE